MLDRAVCAVLCVPEWVDIMDERRAVDRQAAVRLQFDLLCSGSRAFQRSGDAPRRASVRARHGGQQRAARRREVVAVHERRSVRGVRGRQPQLGQVVAQRGAELAARRRVRVLRGRHVAWCRRGAATHAMYADARHHPRRAPQAGTLVQLQALDDPCTPRAALRPTAR